jgi:hypothetical protein
MRDATKCTGKDLYVDYRVIKGLPTLCEGLTGLQ